MKDFESVDSIVEEAGDKIKKIILEAAKGLEFPEITMGEQKEGGAFAKVERGIVLYDNGGYWVDRRFAILMSDGIYTTRAGLFLSMDETGQHTNYLKSFPDWEKMVEIPENYVNYRKQALEMIRELSL